MLISISQTTPNPPIRYPGTQPHLRGYYSQRFVAGDAVTPIEPGNGQWGFYYDIPCEKNDDGNLIIPAFEIYSTTDGNLPTSRFTGQLYDQSGAPREIIFGNTPANSGWQIPTLFGNNVTWADLFRYNQLARLLNPPPAYATIGEIIIIGDARWGQFDYARVGHNGIGQPDVAPDDPTAPIWVGINSPLLHNGASLLRGIATLASSDGLSFVAVTGISEVTLNSPIKVFPLDDSVSGVPRAIGRVAGSGFTIISDNGLDTGRVVWYLDSDV